MDSLFDTSLAFRNILINKVENLSDEQWDMIPEGFNNNIRWTMAHLIVTPTLLTYKLVGAENPLLSEEFIDSARKGTNPENFCLTEDFGKKHLCEMLVEVMKQTQRDLEDLQAKDFKAYETSSGYVIKDVLSALCYSNIHDGIHFGSVLAMIKQIETEA